MFFVCAILSGLKSFYILASGIVRALWRRWLRPLFQSRDRLYYNYADQKGKEKSWAVVTGGSDGIGFAMCENLAK